MNEWEQRLMWKHPLLKAEIPSFSSPLKFCGKVTQAILSSDQHCIVQLTEHLSL